MDRQKQTSKINTWKPKEYQKIVEKDGKLFKCHFDRLFNFPDRLKPYETFIIGKESYINQLDVITKYTNFFMNNYDFENELAMAYLRIKFALDKNHMFDKDSMNGYIDFIYETMFTDSMIDKIVKMTEENYLDDVESVDESDKKYLKNANKKHLESLEFTNQHIMILLEISFAMKIMSPVLLHYIQINHIKLEKDSDIIFRFYFRLFSLFGYGNTYECCKEDGEPVREKITKEEFENIIFENDLTPTYKKDEREPYYYFHYTYPDTGETEVRYYSRTRVDMYAKLFTYVKAKVLESNANNSIIFSQREIFGIDLYSVVDLFTKKVLISENVVKYKFNEHYDAKQKKYKENVVGFNKTIIKYQLSYFLKEQYSKNLTEVTNAKNAEGLSGSDKLMMNVAKIDESIIVMSELDIEFTIKRLMDRNDIPITQDEIEYYKKYHKISALQQGLVYSHYSKYFGSYRNLNLLTRTQYITLLLLLKKKLLIELGYSVDEKGELHYASLPYILTGNVADKISTRIIRNSGFNNKIEENEKYQKLQNDTYSLLKYIDPEKIKGILSSINNTRFTYVVYECPELLGTDIYYPENKILDELTFFLDQ